jgi:hypothetical protein
MLSITKVILKLVVDKLMCLSTRGIILVAKPEYSEKKLSLCLFVHHRSHIDWPGIELGLLQCETGDGLNGPKGLC